MKDTYDEYEEMMLALEMKKSMGKIAKSKRIKTDKETETRIAEVMKVN